MNRDDFGNLIGSSSRTVRRWENGEAEPSSMACKILYALEQQLGEQAPEAEGPRRKPVTA